MSLMREYAKPVTKNITVMYTTGNSTYMIDHDTLLSYLPTNSWTELGTNGSIFMLNTRTDFSGFAFSINDNISNDGIKLFPSDMLREIGEELRFGVQGEDSSFLVFRKVQLTRSPIVGKGGYGSGSTNYGNGQVGYVVVENNYSGVNESLDYIQCYVARI